MKSKVSVVVMVLTFLVLGTVPLAQAKEGRWLETGKWTGGGAMNTECFLISGSVWRVRYAPEGRGPLKISLCDRSGEVVTTVLETPEALRGYRSFKGGQGVHYLKIESTGNHWEIKVEQYLNIVEEWQTVNWVRNNRPNLRKVGAWFGGEADAQYEISIPYPGWKVQFASAGEGTLQVTMTDGEGSSPLNASLLGTGECEGWAYQPGTYTLKIKAEQTGWAVNVFALQNQPRN
jgi:hypothetical protein